MNSLKENLPLATDVKHYISKEEYIAGIINSISKKYPNLRQQSKGP